MRSYGGCKRFNPAAKDDGETCPLIRWSVISVIGRMFMGEKIVRGASQKLPRILVKWIALWAPIPWPKGFQAAPELDKKLAALRPYNLRKTCVNSAISSSASLAGLRTSPGGSIPTWAPCPGGECMRFGYLHTEHFLRQFGA
jgi:hypothetical protein